MRWPRRNLRLLSLVLEEPFRERWMACLVKYLSPITERFWCAVKRRWSTAGEKPARELVRSSRSGNASLQHRGSQE